MVEGLDHHAVGWAPPVPVLSPRSTPRRSIYRSNRYQPHQRNHRRLRGRTRLTRLRVGCAPIAASRVISNFWLLPKRNRQPSAAFRRKMDTATGERMRRRDPADLCRHVSQTALFIFRKCFRIRWAGLLGSFSMFRTRAEIAQYTLPEARSVLRHFGAAPQE